MVQRQTVVVFNVPKMMNVKVGHTLDAQIEKILIILFMIHVKIGFK